MAKKSSGGAAKKAGTEKAAGAPASRRGWLDDADEPTIHTYTERLNSFLEAMADGKVESHELEAQERRLTKLLKEIEPKLDEALHARVTELLCELSAYNIMRTVHEIAEARPATKFRG